MNVEKCLKILRDIKDIAFASVDDQGNPKIRIIDVMYVDDHQLVFCTARGKNFYHEITNHNKLALTGLTDKYEMVTLHGTATKLDNQKEWIDKIFMDNPSMNDIYPGDSRYVLEAFTIKEGEIEYFDLGSQPIGRNRFVLSSNEIVSHGFKISDQCIGCGSCQRQCPQQCINEGNPYSINQEHCLHCGLCFEVCPVKAIERS